MSGAYQHQLRRNPFPGKRTQLRMAPKVGSHYPRTSRSLMEAPQTWDLDPSLLNTYFENHPKLLDEIILNLSENKIIYLLHIQEKRSNIWESASKGQNNRSDPQKRYELSSIKVQSQAFLREGKEPDLSKVLFNAAESLAATLQVDWFSLYLPTRNNTSLYEYDTGGSETHHGVITKGTTVSAEAALLGETLIVENLQQDDRYPKGVGHPERDVHSVLSIPIVSSSDDMLCVIELCRDRFKKPFGKHDLVPVNWLLGWMACSLQQVNRNRILDLQTKLNDFLLNLLYKKVSIDKLVEQILLFSKDLVHADRFVMFLITEENNNLYADYFYEGLSKKRKHVFLTEKQLPFSCHNGIVGHVFKTGQPVNICDAYEDKRFDPTVDEINGYQTKSLLCMPIVTRSRVVGVIGMVNRLSRDHFTHEDEHVFKDYAVYCALALHNARMQNKLHLCEHFCKLKYEMLQYHIVAPEAESRMLKKDTPPEIIPDKFFLYDFNPYVHEKVLPQLFIYIIHDQFGTDTFDFTKLCRFIMTVRKNYRPLAYHNWIHGFQLAHSLYCMVRTNRGIFTSQEVMAMIIAGLCHDLDHRGYNNVFYQKLNLPLADLYGSSVMEQHHYKHTVTIMQLKDHDIFCFLNATEYKEMLEMIHDAILSTDVSRFFNDKDEIVKLIESKTFDVQIDHCRKLIKSLMLTAADLCSVAKPWSTQLDMVTRLYREFYLQGDVEKTHGLQPNETMDRHLRNKIPHQQVNFILFICQPLYSTVVRVLPGTMPLLKGTMLNLTMWQTLMNEKKQGDIFKNLDLTRKD
ncbi:cAMP and cAMP-inhibited cGMP 3',5'-cyclic phosphodiesterase 10A-like [Gigantopelta aegis]|uniref:cAMP and cAMP-inhibited cGMP 3',5'-cyclic phosphodiesterase 10A-like n=1 Tax=Gigantopelta aegis TaxID=1735272 RepID=UPI001B88E085|nr:cAMP and cAMP-inhibited cGMP 3',5'-cyclic phosphodiesterase 10A-like [Gigantopelta aegis]